MVIVGCHRNLYEANTWWSITSTSLISLSSHFCACMHICASAQRHLKMKSFKNNKSSHGTPVPFVFCSVVGNPNESDGGRVGGAEQEHLIWKAKLSTTECGHQCLGDLTSALRFLWVQIVCRLYKSPPCVCACKRSCYYVTVPVVHISELGGW